MARLLLRALTFVVALALLAGVLYLGVLSTDGNAKTVAWFGLAAAFVVPIAFSLIGLAFSGSKPDVFSRLERVPEIERLVAEAKTQEEKVRVLKEQEANLIATIETESRRQALRDRKAGLQREAGRILAEFDAVEEELALAEKPAPGEATSEVIKNLRKRIEARVRGDIILSVGKQTVVIDQEFFRAFPFGVGTLFLTYVRLLQSLQQRRSVKNGP